MAKSIIVVGNTKQEAEQWIANKDISQPCIAVGKDLDPRSIEGTPVIQVLILNTVKDFPAEHIYQLRRLLTMSTGGARTLEAVMRKRGDA